LAKEQTTELGVSELDRGQLDDSRVLIEVKILFGFIEILQPKKRQKLAFSVDFFPESRTRGEKTSATKNDHLNKWDL
jgi:hypothetical protein